MSDLSRRSFLNFIGATTAASAASGLFAQHAMAAPLNLGFTPVRVPFPLPIYTTNNNFLPTGLNGLGSVTSAVELGGPAVELASYTVIDDVVVPPEYERYIISAWGDRPFANTAYSSTADYVGYNCDYTGYVPLAGTNDGVLWQNHEYTSYPFSELAPGTAAGLLNNTFQRVVGYAIPASKTREYMAESLYNVGGSVLRIKRVSRGGRFAVQNGDVLNRRFHGLSGLGINSTRTDVYYTTARPATATYSQVTAWGTLAHQVGDQNYLVGTGAAATDVFVGVNADTLGNKIIGTLANCSGGTTPWGTILSCEENFQADANLFYLGVTEGVKANGSQTGYINSGVQTDTGLRTAGAEFGLVGEKYGWVTEVDVKNPANRAKKHTALGRFRHENVALRVEPGKKLAAYMGDDRRGGHVWKFVSDAVVSNVTAPGNSALFENGTLYVAKFNANGTGSWIPMLLSTPTNPVSPTAISQPQADAQGGTRDRNGLVNLPRRLGVAGSATDGGFFALTTLNEATAIAGYQGQTLANFYSTQGAILVDAFPAANLVGGTPTARPEDVEVHPRTKEVFIAFTDGAAGGDGYADARIFTVSKYSTAINAESQNGGLYKIVESGNTPDALTFTWSRFAQSGEAGAAGGLGFGNLDNLAFDAKFNVWGVMDQSTGLHNGVTLGATPADISISHAAVGSAAGASLVGVYGNNWMFYIPTEGPDAGKQVPFAIGPVRSEMTGPTFVGDHLFLAVQHPGEDSPIDAQSGTRTRVIEMLALNGSTTFNQTRTIPLGSQWPSNTVAGNTSGLPKPAVIGIRRKNGGAFI